MMHFRHISVKIQPKNLNPIFIITVVLSSERQHFDWEAAPLDPSVDALAYISINCNVYQT